MADIARSKCVDYVVLSHHWYASEGDYAIRKFMPQGHAAIDIWVAEFAQPFVAITKLALHLRLVENSVNSINHRQNVDHLDMPFEVRMTRKDIVQIMSASKVQPIQQHF